MANHHLVSPEADFQIAVWNRAKERSFHSLEADLLVDAIDFLQDENCPLEERIEKLADVLNQHFLDDWELTYSKAKEGIN